MPYTIYWLVDKRLLCIDFFDVVDLAQLKQAFEIAADSLSDSTHPVSVVLNTQEVTSHPRNVVMVSQVTRSFFRHRQLQGILHVSNNVHQKYLADILARIFHVPLRSFTAMDTAYNWIESHKTLQTVLPPRSQWQTTDIVA